MESFGEYIAVRGAKARIAAQLGVSHAAIQQWGSRVPAERVVAVEQITGIPREKLRPDLYRQDKPAPARKPRQPAGQPAQ